MDHLRYSAFALWRTMLLAVMAMPVVLFPAFDPDVVTGQYHGRYALLIRAIGPHGLFVVGAALCCVLSLGVGASAVLLAGGRSAASADTDGLAIRTTFYRHRIAWPQVLRIEIERRTVRRRTFHWLSVELSTNGLLRRVRLPVQLLDADLAAVQLWIDRIESRRRGGRERVSNASRPLASARPIFGRKPAIPS